MFGGLFGGGDIEILPQELKERMERGEDILLIDVREDWEHARVKLPGARHIPLAKLPQMLSQIDPKKDIVVYCHHGARSMQACQFMKKNGFEKIKNLRGGIDAYARVVDRSLPTY
ncbi:rhodanese-like domain-containing protein [Leptospirillum ferriphilum]|jgi:rhodanese-related sulfurtransferase|uniref:Sulfurtransferase n=4 Tax=Leptospirillum TaxID=179 RepID=A0A059XSA0_9BACT|nr:MULTISPECIES: rhodanese-like domain-containing protein [Leptospirillum]EAY57841.1 MAG: putative rhodanese-like domain protein [Leptospirillum rubarum]EDZ39657.1 MAG: Putative rhodanese-like domain protein [Leptospirillum sp. Group II '5-way CG']EIJ76061.1 MAG: Putative rhodanese-like domain protein [Leptospirillum sp. Group II 'C75']AFS52448.1 putative rhodanese-like domain protein [Leptospirillum ferriphilum ML-04]AIA29930.1 sulfurtransferase [Leptospirillum ferriphilum YSK]